jgi:hypothetical protein
MSAAAARWGHFEMSSFDRTMAALVLSATLAAPGLGMAEPQHTAAMGDLMTAFVQPRHIKLGLAGSRRNWSYAGYELDQLRETFADVAAILPKYRDLSIPDMITATVKQPLAAVDQAIKARDSGQFTRAYRQLTAACNACHRSYDRGMIVMRPPAGGGTYPDQDFRPGRQ